MSFSTVILV